MKRNIFIKGILGALMIGGLASCSSDYLYRPPKTNLDSSTASASVEGASLALNGLCRSMYMQYGNISTTPNFNGEPYMAMCYGEMQGQDDFLNVWCIRFGVEFSNWNNNINYNGIMPSWAWRYCYGLISQANNILQGEESAVGDVNERKNVMAQVYTMRAHAYFRLLQIYAPRWEDSNNGNVKCIVIRVKPTVEEVDCSTMAEVLDLVYSDLDKAIQLYTESGLPNSSFSWRPNIDIARGIYARVAMLKHDYKKAQEMANAARKNYDLMTADEYSQGFQPTKGWMWYNNSQLAGIYFWGWGSWYACNGAYTERWGYGAGTMNYDLYREIQDTDVRKKMYLFPEALDLEGIMYNKKLFWNAKAVGIGDMNLLNGNGAMALAVADFKEARTLPGFREPYYQMTEGSFRIPFGAQFKVWGLDEYGSNSMPFMRAEEMLLTEAEAAAYNGDVATAQSCLNALYAVRNPGQTCTTTGDALMEEIRIQRRIELWGEGFNWYDFKRWNIPLVRRIWVENDESSNNIPPAYGMTKEPSDPEWRLVVPNSETQYNRAIDRSTLGYNFSGS